MTLRPVRIGCSGWNYADWRGRGLPGRAARRGAGSRTTRRCSTPSRSTRPSTGSPSPAAVARWVEDTPPDFLFTVKASRYLTHMKRLTDMERGVERLYAGIAPLVESPKLGPVLWQLPERFHRDDDRLAFALERLPPGRHASSSATRAGSRRRSTACCTRSASRSSIGDDSRAARCRARAAHRRLDAHPLPLRRARAARQLLRDRAARVGGADRATCAGEADVLAYFNNDWEGFAVRNGLRSEAAAGGLKPAARC